MNIQQMIRRSPLFLLGLLGLTLFTSPVAAQVFDLGPSDSAFFDTVINVPTDPNIGDAQSVGGGDLLIQLNISDGGSVGDDFVSNNRSEINISGGTVGQNFSANGGSEVNITGGNVGRFFDARINSTVNVSGGSISDFADANSGSEVNISGGIVGFGFRAANNSVVKISGGRVGRGFTAVSRSDVELIGGEFQFNGNAFADDTIFLNRGDTFTGTLADGSAFIFSNRSEDRPTNDVLVDVRLTSVALPVLDLSPIVVSTSNPDVPSGLRPGQTLNLLSGGVLGSNFEVASASLNVEGGSLGSFAAAYNSTVNINDGSVGNFFTALSGGEVNINGGDVGEGFDAFTGSEVNINGGNVGEGFIAFSGSEVNISGGTIGDLFEARFGSEINLFGSSFAINGDPLDSLAMGDTMRIFDRDVTVTGQLADGTPFSLDLNTNFGLNNVGFFSTGAVITVTQVLEAPPTFAQTLTHVPLFTFDGDAADDEFGFSVSDAGDVNGDGFADLIVGAPSDDNNGVSSGSARVLSGIDGSVLYNFEGDAAGDNFGHSVSGAGDVNGDGFADLIVGITGGLDSPSSGSARVFSGSDGSVLYNFDGDLAGDRFGFSVSGAGDVNGDGFADLIVGAPNDVLNGIGGGKAWVFSGSDGSVLYNFDGDAQGDNFGRSVSDAGDVNGDGVPDLIVGAPFDEARGSFLAGTVRVFSGSDGSVIHDIVGDRSLDVLGWSVSGAGDVNGDGFDDLIAGAPADNIYGGSSGSIRVFSGADATLLYNFEGDLGGDFFGGSVSGAGDVNGDGVPDLLVGGPREANTNIGNGSVRVFSGASGRVLYNFVGASVGDRFGSSVSGAGDVNGDGVADFIVGSLGAGARLFVSQVTVPFILGDANLDGVVDFADIPSFIAILQSGTYLEQADANQDGEVSFADIPAFIEILSGT